MNLFKKKPETFQQRLEELIEDCKKTDKAYVARWHESERPTILLYDTQFLAQGLGKLICYAKETDRIVDIYGLR